MSDEAQVAQESKNNDKEYNFRQIEKKLLEEREARAQERAAREELEREVQKLKSFQQQNTQQDDDDDSEPYVDHKRLNKTLSKFGQNTQTEINKAMEMAKKDAKEELRKEIWLESNPDFYDTLQQHAEKLHARAPKLAESILKMPDSFERQQLVYNNIKALGLDKSEQAESSIQKKIDGNRRGNFYQPTGVGTSPYASAGDFSEAGQKSAFNKMKELQSRLRLG